MTVFCKDVVLNAPRIRTLLGSWTTKHARGGGRGLFAGITLVPLDICFVPLPPPCAGPFFAAFVWFSVVPDTTDTMFTPMCSETDFSWVPRPVRIHWRMGSYNLSTT